MEHRYWAEPISSRFEQIPELAVLKKDGGDNLTMTQNLRWSEIVAGDEEGGQTEGFLRGGGGGAGRHRGIP
jgi:hypothetical protein